ncbi:carbohydrate ABC transporter substrate-binding protein [Pantoea sp. Al-1710]|uniref:Carbohydrate ABC transporter substrate-binding protein n=1 Tax=Candidatus Pantoea communis TaxID=2608354 RepID=A0ABX0RUL4_9GAMM|nr:carbohydrate ABC transporter substrate-binding protein [Pantoea communis]NIG19330.1 carbohydrate ABC transporter substrate-binding protein [Pantoea communis]
MKVFKGLTWDHPRGYKPLQAWAEADKSATVEWSIQKLEGFESHPINELAETYDLLIVDNPGIGEAAEEKCLRPLEDFLSAEQMRFLKQSSMGSSFESYCYKGQHWAIPIDAASQVCAVAGDASDAIPLTWNAVQLYAWSNPGRVALSLGGPHALLTFYSICQSLGGTLFEGNEFVLEPQIGIRALDMMNDIFLRQQKDLIDLNPIGLLDEMAKGTFDLCPAIFGYVNYSSPTTGRMVLFTDIPHCGNPALRGSVLGGTGLAVSVNCEPEPALIEHIMRYVSDEVQRSLVVESGGQPSNAAAWQYDRANDLTQGFFSNTFDTVSNAYVRPKYHGYIPFQDTSSAIIRRGLAENRQSSEILSDVKNNHARYRP